MAIYETYIYNYFLVCGICVGGDDYYYVLEVIVYLLIIRFV